MPKKSEQVDKAKVGLDFLNDQILKTQEITLKWQNTVKEMNKMGAQILSPSQHELVRHTKRRT